MYLFYDSFSCRVFEIFGNEIDKFSDIFEFVFLGGRGGRIGNLKLISIII